MRFLEDERLYHRTQECLDWLRQLGPGDLGGSSRAPEPCHLYWHGPFSRKQAFAVKSFLATQDLARTDLWLWLDSRSGYDGHEENPLLRPLLPHLQVRRFDPESEARDTPVEGRHDLYGARPKWASDLFRHVVLFRHGGIYADLDTMFLRDFRDLPAAADEFCYRWSARKPYGSSAVMRLRPRGESARALLVTCAEKGTCHPREVLRFDDNEGVNLLVLPSAAFDPLWAHHDRKDTYEAAPFNRFGGFFRGFDSRFRPRADIRSYRDFFPGAFAYQWHGRWDVPEHRDSYFGRFEAEFDGILADRLGIEPARV